MTNRLEWNPLPVYELHPGWVEEYDGHHHVVHLPHHICTLKQARLPRIKMVPCKDF